MPWSRHPVQSSVLSRRKESSLTYLVVCVRLSLGRVGLVQLVLDQVVLRVHDVQVLVLVAVPVILLVLAGAADVVEHLPQFVTLGWST